jgi:hypothetical protein
MYYKIIKLSTKVILDLKDELFWRPKIGDLCLLLPEPKSLLLNKIYSRGITNIGKGVYHVRNNL